MISNIMHQHVLAMFYSETYKLEPISSPYLFVTIEGELEGYE